MAAKGIVKGIVTAAAICGIGAGCWALYKHYGGKESDRSEKVYVQKVATVNTVDGANLFATNFAGVIVAQKTVDVKYDASKQVDEILVHEGGNITINFKFNDAYENVVNYIEMNKEIVEEADKKSA